MVGRGAVSREVDEGRLCGGGLGTKGDDPEGQGRALTVDKKGRAPGVVPCVCMGRGRLVMEWEW